MDYRKTAQDILDHVGGSKNIASAAHCATRLRLVIADNKKVSKEALENVLSSLKMEGLNFLFLIIGRKEKVDFYYGISKDLSDHKSLDFAIKDIGDNILKPSIQGNFRGSKTKSLCADERNDIIEVISAMPEVGIIEGVPGANKDDEKYQGIDRLINVMYGDTYCFMVVAKPLNIDAVLEIQNNLYEFYDMKSSFSKKSVQIGLLVLPLQRREHLIAIRIQVGQMMVGVKVVLQVKQRMDKVVIHPRSESPTVNLVGKRILMHIQRVKMIPKRKRSEQAIPLQKMTVLQKQQVPELPHLKPLQWNTAIETCSKYTWRYTG